MNVNSAPGTRRNRLLVVDDDRDILEATQMLLEDMGLEVEVSSSGREVVDKLRAGNRYDLVLCDLGMPEIDGWQVARAVRQSSPETKFYMLTGWATEIGAADPKRGLVDGVLCKPIELDNLEKILARDLAG
jgi:CheY-like chemotaxis protein